MSEGPVGRLGYMTWTGIMVPPGYLEIALWGERIQAEDGCQTVIPRPKAGSHACLANETSTLVANNVDSHLSSLDGSL